jgi:predicted Zn-dependent protease
MQAAGAVSKKEDGLVLITSLPSNKTYHQYADDLKKKISSSSSLKIESDKDTSINDIPAHLIKALADANTKQPFVIETLLLGYNGNNFQLLGLSSADLQSSTHTSLTSFRKITPVESESVKMHVIHIEKANAEEPIAAFSARTKNLFDLKTTALINALSEHASLPQGALLKIMSEEPIK